MIGSLALLEIQLLAGGVNVDIESHKEAAKLALYVTTTALSQKHKADMRLLAARHNYEPAQGYAQNGQGEPCTLEKLACFA